MSSSSYPRWPLLLLYVYEFIQVGAYACVYILCGGQQSMSYFLQLISNLFFESGTHWTQSSRIWLDWLSPVNLLSVPPWHWDSRCILLCLGFCLGTGDANSGPYTCTAYILLTEPFSQPPYSFKISGFYLFQLFLSLYLDVLWNNTY